MKPSALRAIPSVERILQSLGDTGMPRPAVTALVRRELAALRKQKMVPGYEGVLSGIRTALDAFRAGRIPRKLYANASSPVEGLVGR